MNERQEKLLSSIIDIYVKTAEPVGSKLLSDIFDLSSATIRNEMMELEELGFVDQPHPSAGRVPVEKGYRYYVDNFLIKKKISTRNLSTIQAAMTLEDDLEASLKNIAKKIAEISDQTIFVIFDRSSVYYTGIANLFAKPEFGQQNIIRGLSQVIDQLDEVVFNFYDQVDDGVKIMIGSENPLGKNCSLLLGRYNYRAKNQGVLGILGPMRMDYGFCAGIIEQVQDSLLK